jgi:hypothetical protein
MFSSKAARSVNPEAYSLPVRRGDARLRTLLEDIFSMTNSGMLKKANAKAAVSADSRRTVPGTSRIQATRERRRWAFSTSRESRSGGMADTHV